MLVPKFAFICCCCCTHAVLIQKFPTMGATAHHHGVDDILLPARDRRDDHDDFLTNQDDAFAQPIKGRDEYDQEKDVTDDTHDNHDDDFHTFNDHNTDNRNGTIDPDDHDHDHGWTRRGLKIVNIQREFDFGRNYSSKFLL